MSNNNMKLEFASLQYCNGMSGSGNSGSCGNTDSSTIEWDCYHKCIFGFPIKICIPKKK